jgi:HlyD family secretion protein
MKVPNKPVVLALTLLVLFGGVLLSIDRGIPPPARDGAAVQPAPPGVPTDTVVVRLIRAPRTIELTGTVRPSLTADVAPKVMGKVAAVEVKEGDRVTAGQVLARLESADLAAQVQQSGAAVAAARAALAQAQTGLGIQRTQSSTRVEQARAALRQAQEQWSLVKEGSRRQQKAQADEFVRQARATLASAQAQLSLVNEGARRQQKLQADAALREAEASLKTARVTHDRFKSLVDQGAISQQQYDEVALRLEVARSQYETAKQQVSLVYEGARTQEVLQAEEGVGQAEAAVRSAAAQRDLTYEGSRSQEVAQSEAQVRQAEQALRMARAATSETQVKADNVRMLRAQVAQAEANLSAARVQLSYATLLAPFSGVITGRHVDPGAMATPGMPLITLVDPSSFRIEALVPESQIQSAHLGDRPQVTIDALGQSLQGRVTQIVPSADPASRTFVVKISLPNVPGLSSGLFGRVKIAAGTTQGMYLPEAALSRRESLTGVFVVSNGTFHERLVTVGKVDGGKAEILSGLQSGERVVARDLDRLRDGALTHLRWVPGTGGEAP